MTDRRRRAPPTLLLLKGPPGSGKSTLATEIGRRLGWPVIDKDAFRDLLPDDLGGLSYEAMLRLAARQLAIGLSVTADSPLGYGTSYRMAIEIGRTAGARVLVLECECSDLVEWRRRIEQRAGTGLASHHATDWTKVESFHERTAADPYEVDVPRLVVDTAAPLDETLRRALGWLMAPREPESIAVLGIDHVQLAMPVGQEEAARRFYAGVLGLTEAAKPAGLEGRGGCWFIGPATHLHLGVEADFRPAARAHPALVVVELDAARRKLTGAGVDVVDDDSIDVRRFYASDPFGNRLEFVGVEDRGFSDQDGLQARRAALGS